MPLGIGTTAQLTTMTGVSESTTTVQAALGISTSTATSKSQKIIEGMEADIASKLVQRDQVSDLLLLIDIDLDMYDELIQEIDRKIPALINEINQAAIGVQNSYRARVSNGCRNDLHWVQTSSKTVTGVGTMGPMTYTTYEVQKIPSEYRQINLYGVKYYKRPKDRDYGASAIKELANASVGIGSTYMVVYDTTTDANGFTILSGIQTNDTITDSIEQPTIFTIGSLPEVVGFGSTSLLGIKTTFGGSISIGSTVLAYTGFNTTAGLVIGDKVWRTGITSTDSLVVGFGTTTVSITGIDTLGITTTFYINTNSIILSKPAIASTDQGVFNIGIYTSYPTIFISTTTESGTSGDNFFVLRNSNADEIFDPTTNGENPVEVGMIKDFSKIGYGHSIILINNGSPDVVSTYIEDIEAEPSVGAGFAYYYEGNTSWPTVSIPTTVPGGPGLPPVVTGYNSSYASEGQVITTVTGFGQASSGVSYAGSSAANPPAGTCNASDSAINSAENNFYDIKQTNIDIINDLIDKAEVLRNIRDKKQSTAWSYRRGRGSITNDINTLRANIEKMKTIDYTEFESN